MPPALLSESFRVRAYEIDPEARLALPALCDWLQEAAGNHATDLGVATDRLLESGRAWVLSRLRVEIAALPRWRQRVTVETWPSAENGLVAERDFLVLDEHGAPLARAISHWVIIDVARRRPVRLPEAVTGIELPDRQRALTPAASPLAPPDQSALVRHFSVRRSDLDLNLHVNNVRYVEWALEAVPDDVLQTHDCASIDVQFRAESVYGDTIASRAGAPLAGEDGLTIRHAVTREGDDRQLAVLATRWRQQG